MFKPAFLLVAAPLLLAGCVKDPLDDLQTASMNLQTCLIKRTYRDECEALRNTLEITKLTAIKKGGQTTQIDAAIALGNRLVGGREDDSPYADFLKRRREVLAQNLLKVSPEKFAEDERLANAVASLQNTGEPVSKRQQAENMLVQAMLEEQYPTYFAEPENGIEADPEILALTCKDGTRAMQAQACVRFKKKP